MSTKVERDLEKRLTALQEDHQMLQKTLTEVVQPQMRGLLAQSNRADQIVKAVKNGSVKTPRFMPKVDAGYWPMVRMLCVQAVYSLWERERRATTDRREIVPIVQDKVRHLKTLGRWPQNWSVPGRDTIIRRLQESADSRHYDGETPVIAVKAGSYLPNPLKFEEPARSELRVLVG